MPTIDELIEVRKQKLQRLRQQGIDPFASNTSRSHRVSDARVNEGAAVCVAGRIMSMRGHGKIIFFDLRDESGTIQVVAKADQLESKYFSLIQLLDVGDFIEVSGLVDKTNAGEISVFATKMLMLTKSLRPLPSEWHGLKDIEDRYRQRYVDLNVNEGVKNIFYTRAKVIKFLRKFLDGNGFIEVETPALQPLYGGASAKPFTTHHNALDVDMFLRISDELYLKRMIVGGFDKVYEIAKDFRNEGIDKQHNPEFTMLEYYWAYANYDDLMNFTERMFVEMLQEILGTLTITFQGTTIDFSSPWKRKTYRDVVLEYSGIDITVANTEEKLVQQIREKKINVDLTGCIGYGAILDTLYKVTARPYLTGPLFLTDRPTAFVTLAKRKIDDASTTSSFQLLIVGKEVINAYNELNDPIDQANRWRESEKLGERGQEEFEAFDHDYVRALEYGMPPTAGFGMGIDRLVSLLTDQPNIKDVILFPTLRPEFTNEKSPFIHTEVNKAETEKSSPVLTKDDAVQLLVEHIQNVNLRRHCFAVGYALKALASKFGGDPDMWELLGIVHDLDWEETKNTPELHTIKTLEYLRNKGMQDGEVVQALKSHNRKFTKLKELEGEMEWALETCDELTGFIVAVSLVLPDKKIASLTVDSIMKKWRSKGFAQAVNREQISQCKEKLGIALEEFISIILRAMQEHDKELGL